MTMRIKVIKVILGAIGFLSFFFVIGVAGGVERDSLPLLKGFFLAMSGIGVMSLCVMINNWIDREIERFNRRIQYREYREHMERIRQERDECGR